MFKALLIATILFSSTSIFAQEIDESQFITSFEISKVDVGVEADTDTDTDADLDVELRSQFAAALGGPIGEISMYLDGLIAIGTKIWPIVEAGKPVISTSGIVKSISVLPDFNGADPKREFYEMANWSIPKAASYRVSFKNKFKSEVVGFTYTVYFQYNGNHNGNGKYITNLKIQASNTSAAWGFKFNAKSELIGISNVGTLKNPIASAIIQISYTAKSALNEIRSSQSFYVDGSGRMKLLRK